MCACELLSCARFFATPWTVTLQASLSMGFSRQEYWSGLPFPPPGDLPNPGIKPQSPALQADPLPSQPPGKPYYNPDVSRGSIAMSSVVCLPTLFLPFVCPLHPQVPWFVHDGFGQTRSPLSSHAFHSPSRFQFKCHPPEMSLNSEDEVCNIMTS